MASKVAITFDNIRSAPLQINNTWIDRDDGISIIAVTSNSMQINPPAVFIPGTIDPSGSGFTPEEKAALMGNTSMIPFVAFTPSNSDILGN